MKTINIKPNVLIIIFLLFSSVNYSNAQEPLKHQITFSFTISGFPLLGVGYNYFFDQHNAAQATFFVIPGKGGVLFAASTGYSYYFGNKLWHPNLGLEFLIIRGPPDPEERTYMPFINIVPGIQYEFNEYHSLNGKIWVAYMPTEKPFSMFPIGLEFKYGYNIKDEKTQ